MRKPLTLGWRLSGSAGVAFGGKLSGITLSALLNGVRCGGAICTSNGSLETDDELDVDDDDDKSDELDTSNEEVERVDDEDDDDEEELDEDEDEDDDDDEDDG